MGGEKIKKFREAASGLGRRGHRGLHRGICTPWPFQGVLE